jgi:hypothetical protein
MKGTMEAATTRVNKHLSCAHVTHGLHKRVKQFLTERVLLGVS